MHEYILAFLVSFIDIILSYLQNTAEIIDVFSTNLSCVYFIIFFLHKKSKFRHMFFLLTSLLILSYLIIDYRSILGVFYAIKEAISGGELTNYIYDLPGEFLCNRTNILYLLRLGFLYIMYRVRDYKLNEDQNSVTYILTFISLLTLVNIGFMCWFLKINSNTVEVIFFPSFISKIYSFFQNITWNVIFGVSTLSYKVILNSVYMLSFYECYILNKSFGENIFIYDLLNSSKEFIYFLIGMMISIIVLDYFNLYNIIVKSLMILTGSSLSLCAIFGFIKILRAFYLINYNIFFIFLLWKVFQEILTYHGSLLIMTIIHVFTLFMNMDFGADEKKL